MSYPYIVKNLLAVMTFVSFSWAASCFFIVQDEGARKGKKIISFLGLPSMLATIYLVFQSKEMLIIQNLISSLLFVISLIIFWSSIQAAKKNHLSFAFSKEKPTGVVQSGPFKYVRHPFYVSYTLAWLAGFLGTGNFILLAVCVVMFILYYRSAKFEEDVILSSDLKNQYLGYKKTTGMFFPKIIK